jgi:GT2 family glycosyltransferase
MLPPAEIPPRDSTQSHSPDTTNPKVAVIIPSLGSPSLGDCLQAVAKLEPPPERTIVVLSGSANPPPASAGAEILVSQRRLGFAAAVNIAIDKLGDSTTAIALLNDDALPPPNWLEILARALAVDPGLAAVQGTVTNQDGSAVDGRGIALDPYGLPIQVDHGRAAVADPRESREMVAVSGTAALYRLSALRQSALASGAVFDPSFGSYHEDLDLGLRLLRLGWRTSWVAGVTTTHIGSVTGRQRRWSHPWWMLANRWRALAGNLLPTALVGLLPRLFRGELRAVRTLMRENPRVLVLSIAVLLSLPILTARGWRRITPGPRLSSLPDVS